VAQDHTTGDDYETATAKLRLFGKPFHAQITVPVGPTRLSAMLPLFRALADELVRRAEGEAIAAGRAISCRKGCGACCRQLVPVAGVEAHGLADLVRTLPEPSRSRVLARFDAAERRLTEAGLAGALAAPDDVPPDDVGPLGARYFRLGVACPFLEDESCSIHPDRPLACREYVVTSPAENCADPTPDKVQRLQLPAKVFSALAAMGTDPGALQGRWVPLAFALDWSAAHPESAAVQTGKALLEEFFGRLTGTQVVTPEGGEKRD